MVNKHFDTFIKLLGNSFRFKMFMLSKLPAAFFAGLRIEKLTYDEASISVHYKWFNKNPFRSIYVGILAMPSEVSTGILGMGALYKQVPAVSMLVVKSEGAYVKKAVGKIVFTCKDGAIIQNAVNEAIQTGEGVAVKCHTIGTNQNGEIVAEFDYTWSFKARKSS